MILVLRVGAISIDIVAISPNEQLAIEAIQRRRDADKTPEAELMRQLIGADNKLGPDPRYFIVRVVSMSEVTP